MKLEDLRPAPGAKTRRKRIGRGPGSGHGKTATKGSKGHKARSGGGKAGYRRIPKRGFLPHGGKHPYAIVNLKSLAAFGADSVVDAEGLVKARLIKNSDRERVKILGDGEVPHALTVKVHAISASARQKIEARGGRVELLAAEVSAT